MTATQLAAFEANTTIAPASMAVALVGLGREQYQPAPVAGDCVVVVFVGVYCRKSI